MHKEQQLGAQRVHGAGNVIHVDRAGASPRWLGVGYIIDSVPLFSSLCYSVEGAWDRHRHQVSNGNRHRQGPQTVEGRGRAAGAAAVGASVSRKLSACPPRSFPRFQTVIPYIHNHHRPHRHKPCRKQGTGTLSTRCMHRLMLQQLIVALYFLEGILTHHQDQVMNRCSFHPRHISA